MFTAKVENSGGEGLTLTQNERNFQVISITGINPPKAQINTTPIAGLDGSKFNSSKLYNRNIVITLQINDDVENNRQMLYRFFRTKENCTFYFSNENRDVSIQGYVESVECNLFSKGERMQISIICPNPYFSALQEIVYDLSNELAAFSFPFSINVGDPVPISSYETDRVTDIINNSEAETGVIINIDVNANVSMINILNTDTNEFLKLNYNFVENDRIVINTNKGSKSARLYRNGAVYNIFKYVQKGSTFFQLRIGDNHFTYTITGGDSAVFVTMSFRNLFRGV